MIRRLGVALALAALGWAASACGDDATIGDTVNITGDVGYPETIDPAPTAVINVAVGDTGRADAPAIPLGRQEIPLGAGLPPIPFSVPVPTDELAAAVAPTVRVTMEDADGNLLATTDTVIPVTVPDTGDTASVGSVMMVATAPAPDSDSGSDETAAGTPLNGEWMVTEIAGIPVVENTEPTITFETDGRVTGSTGCNSFNGSYTAEGETISVAEPLAMTRRACVPAVGDQETAFVQVLTTATSATVEASTAMLTLTADDGTTIIARR